MPSLTDDAFLDATADRLAALPGVEAVTLGGSRAQGTHRPDSDWDMAIYYRGSFDPADLRAVGWEGEVCALGAWGGGVFNGGAWLTIDGRRVDVHYRDLDVVEHETAEAEAGRFRVEPLMFHLAGIPTYLVVAELAINRVLRGTLPRPAYPEALRRTAPAHWHGMAAATLAYAKAGHAPRAPSPRSRAPSPSPRRRRRTRCWRRAESGSPTRRASSNGRDWAKPTHSWRSWHRMVRRCPGRSPRPRGCSAVRWPRRRGGRRP